MAIDYVYKIIEKGLVILALERKIRSLCYDVIQDIDKQHGPLQGNLQPRPMSNPGRAIAG